jgi:hypothetical protein
MHYYQDISHFRAPYKNYQTMAGFGLETGTPATPAAEDPAVAMIATMGEDGIRRFRPELVTSVRAMLVAYNGIWLNDSTIRIEPFDAQAVTQASKDPTTAAFLKSRSADKWVSDKIADGFAIYAPFSIIAPNTQTLSGAGIQIGAVQASDYENAKEASKLPIGAFLADPKAGWGSKAKPGEVRPAGVSDPKHALIALAIIGGAGVLFFGINKLMKRRGYGSSALSGSLAR